jgi:hypothetical protein
MDETEREHGKGVSGVVSLIGCMGASIMVMCLSSIGLWHREVSSQSRKEKSKRAEMNDV